MRLRLVVLPVLLAACAQQGADSVTIAAAGPWTEGFGVQNRRGIELAVDEINRKGGIDGMRLVLIAEDDGGDGARAAGIAGNFVANPAIVGVVGHVNSGATIAAARVYDGNLPAISTTASSPDISGLSPWVFRVISSDSVNGQDIARFAQRIGKKRAAMLYENDAYGRGLVEAFRRSFRGEIVAEDPITAEPALLGVHVEYLKQRAPDIVFVASTEQAGMAVLREAKRRGLVTDFIGGDGWTGIVADTAAAQGAYVGAPFSAEDPRPEAQAFVKAFRERYDADPDGNAALGYDATMLLAKAIEQAGADRAKIRDWLAAIDEASAFAGVTGRIRFRESGDVVDKGFVMTRVSGSRLLVQRAEAP